MLFYKPSPFYPQQRMATTALFFFPSSHFSPIHRNPNPNFSKSFSSYLSIASSSSSNNINGISPLLAVPAPRAAVAEIAATSQEHLEISKLGISDQIVSALSRRGITELFPIQRAVLEPAMEGRDMIGRAITGSGKTLAFGIPILDKIIRDNQHSKKRIPSALVLAPTRELARQVQQEFKASAPTLSSTCLYGGISISNQIRTLGFGMDIVVGTPGRIIDLVERGALDLSEVKFVVLDEADQMLAIGFQEAVECILGYLPAKKQCMLFSATMPSWVNQLSRKYLRNPLVVDLVGDSEQKLADGITLYSVASNNTNKPSLLPTLISTYAQGGKSIIFTKTKRDAESLSRSMSSMIGSKALHGDMQQLHRDRTLAAFREGRFDVLVATDVAARGLDIPNVDLVIHFEMPNSSEFFVHRSGRTGRAGNKGTAILMFNESQRRTVRSMERELGFNFEELRGITGTKIEASRSLYESDDDTAGRRPQYGKHGRSQQNTTSRYSQGGNYATSQAYNTPRYSQGGTNYGTSQGYSPSKYGNSWGSNASKYSEGGKFGKSWGSNNSTSRTSERGSYGRPHGSNGNNASRFSDSSRNKSYSSRTPESRYGGGRDNGGSRNQWSKQRDYDDGDDSTRGFSSGSDAPERSYGSRRTPDKGSDFDFDQLLDLFKD